MNAPDFRTGFVGPLPGRRGLAGLGLEAGTLTRWDRWFEIVSVGRLPTRLHPDRPAWRIMAGTGVFAAVPLSGCFRLGHDLDGRVWPFAVLRLGPVPDPADPWYDAAATLVQSATRGAARLRDLAAGIARLPAPQAFAPASDETAVLWRDDWEVRVLHCATVADLTAFPLAEIADAAPADETA